MTLSQLLTGFMMLVKLNLLCDTGPRPVNGRPQHQQFRGLGQACVVTRFIPSQTECDDGKKTPCAPYS